jgi:hypothetical protein
MCLGCGQSFGVARKGDTMAALSRRRMGGARSVTAGLPFAVSAGVFSISDIGVPANLVDGAEGS